MLRTRGRPVVASTAVLVILMLFVGCSSGNTTSTPAPASTPTPAPPTTPATVSPPNKGPVTLWHMDEGSGDIIHDATSNHNDGIITGATLEDGRFGQALKFDGQNDWVTVKQSFVFHKPTDATISFWVKILKPGRYSIFWTRGDEQDLNRFHIWLDVLHFDSPKGGGQLSIAGFDYVSTEGVRHEFNTVQFPQNQWVHVAITRSGDTYRFYKDGILQWELTDTNPGVPDYDGGWFVGRGYSRWGREKTPAQLTMFSGLIDEVAMYDSALSATEISQLASAPVQ